VIVVVSGAATLSPAGQPDQEHDPASWAPVHLTAGDTVLTAYGSGAMAARGDALLLRCRPPAAIRPS